MASAADKARAVAGAKAWAAEQGYRPQLYSIMVSPVQSAPAGSISVEVAHLPTTPEDGRLDPKEQLRRSRLLEVNAETGVVECVLAARDPAMLERILKLEQTRGETERLQGRPDRKSVV